MVQLFSVPMRDPAQNHQDSDALPGNCACCGSEVLAEGSVSIPWRPTNRKHTSAFYIAGNSNLALSQGTFL